MLTFNCASKRQWRMLTLWLCVCWWVTLTHTFSHTEKIFFFPYAKCISFPLSLSPLFGAGGVVDWLGFAFSALPAVPMSVLWLPVLTFVYFSSSFLCVAAGLCCNAIVLSLSFSALGLLCMGERERERTFFWMYMFEKATMTTKKKGYRQRWWGWGWRWTMRTVNIVFNDNKKSLSLGL